MRSAPLSAVRVLVAVACAGLLALAAALPAAGAHQQARDGHSLVEKMPKKWLKAYKLKGATAKPLSDPDRDGACNWVEFRQRTNPRKANRVMTAPPLTDVPARRIILLEGTVVTSAPTAFTLELEGGLLVSVGLSSTAPLVDRDGLPATLAEGQEVHAFVSQRSDLRPRGGAGVRRGRRRRGRQALRSGRGGRGGRGGPGGPGGPGGRGGRAGVRARPASRALTLGARLPGLTLARSASGARSRRRRRSPRPPPGWGSTGRGRRPGRAPRPARPSGR